MNTCLLTAEQNGWEYNWTGEAVLFSALWHCSFSLVSFCSSVFIYKSTQVNNFVNKSNTSVDVMFCSTDSAKHIKCQKLGWTKQNISLSWMLKLTVTQILSVMVLCFKGHLVQTSTDSFFRPRGLLFHPLCFYFYFLYCPTNPPTSKGEHYSHHSAWMAWIQAILFEKSQTFQTQLFR